MSLQVTIKKRLGDFNLNIQLEAEQGITGLLGASGCGKSMTLKCIAGIETPDEGRITLDGEVLFDARSKINCSPQQRGIGYLFQSYALFPNMTVAQNIAAGVRARSAGPAEVQRLIRTLYLEGLADKYPSQLSGGQQQRTALARILASRPRVLLLDEPFSALDSHLKWQVELELMELLSSFQGPVLFVSHSRKEVFRLCTSAYVLDQGRSEAKKPIAALFHAPDTRAACLLTGCKNVLPARIAGPEAVELLDWGVVLACDRPIRPDLTHVGIHAACIHLAPGPGPNRFACRVSRVVDNPYENVLLFCTPLAEDHSQHTRLRVELPRGEWEKQHDQSSLWLQAHPSDLLLLTDSEHP